MGDDIFDIFLSLEIAQLNCKKYMCSYHLLDQCLMFCLFPRLNKFLKHCCPLTTNKLYFLPLGFSKLFWNAYLRQILNFFDIVENSINSRRLIYYLVLSTKTPPKITFLPKHSQLVLFLACPVLAIRLAAWLMFKKCQGHNNQEFHSRIEIPTSEIQ